MLPDNDRIDNLSLFFLYTAIILEFGLLGAPRTFTQDAGPNAWLVVIVSTIPILGVGFFTVRLGQLFPGQTFPEYIPKIVGRWVGNGLCLVLVGYWLINNGRSVRTFAELIKTFLLFRTPIEVIIITLLFFAGYLARGGLEATARFSTLAVIISIPIGSLLLITTYGDWDFSNILPVLEQGWSPVILSGMKTLGQLEGMEALLILLAFVQKPQKSLPYCLGGLMVVQILLLLMTTVLLLDFGPEETARLAIPGVSLIQSAELPGRFLERLGSIYVTVWIIIFFPTTVAFLYLPGVVLAKIFKLNEVKPLILYFIPIIYVISLLPQNREELFELIDKLSLGNIGVIGGIPLFIYLIARLRGFQPKGE